MGENVLGGEWRAPKARSPSRLGGLGERRKLPQRGLGLRPSRQRILEHLISNEACFWQYISVIIHKFELTEID